ncbi:MAG: hypothetical protein JXA07_04105 [Spirochaetes bacterium]|nr:hypothetical protein [Spirochaetota bacterium]
METVGMMETIKVLGNFGVIGLLIFIWWVDSKRYAELLEVYRGDVARLLSQYKEDTDKHWMMYEKNVSLVKDYEKIASSLQELIMANIRTMTELCNEFKRARER